MCYDEVLLLTEQLSRRKTSQRTATRGGGSRARGLLGGSMQESEECGLSMRGPIRRTVV